jgi:aspartate racemase
MNKAAIGVIGGMGPEASSYMFSTLINLASKKFGAKTGDQFPEIVIDSIPVPDFFSDKKNYEAAKEMLIERVQKFNNLNICCLSIACNTAHLLLPDLQRETSVPFISMIEEVVNKILEDKIKTIGLVGSPMTIEGKLYQTPLENLKITVILPSKVEIQELEGIIKNVIDGTQSEKDTKVLKTIVENLKRQGAEGIILGCTELPLVYSKDLLEKVYNSVEILSEALLKRYYAQ